MLEQIFNFVDSYANYLGGLSFWMLFLAVILLLVAHYFIIWAQKFLDSKGLQPIGAIVSALVLFELLFTIYTSFEYIGLDWKLLLVGLYWLLMYFFGTSELSKTQNTRK